MYFRVFCASFTEGGEGDAPTVPTRAWGPVVLGRRGHTLERLLISFPGGKEPRGPPSDVSRCSSPLGPETRTRRSPVYWLDLAYFFLSLFALLQNLFYDLALSVGGLCS